MKPFQTLRPLVQLVPAAAVAAAVCLTLPHTEPVLAAVPERLTPPVETAREAAVEEVPEEEVLPRLPYPDGVYTGSARGYGGPVKVQVTMENGTITGVEILNASHETAAFLKRARRLLNTVVTAQTWEVDAVSEATYTSRGILGAVQNALTGEVVNNPAPPQPKPAEPPVVETFTPPSAYRDGVYTASAPGYGGPITVQVTVQSDVITDITIVSHDGETTSYFSRARKVVSDILERGTPEDRHGGNARRKRSAGRNAGTARRSRRAGRFRHRSIRGSPGCFGACRTGDRLVRPCRLLGTGRGRPVGPVRAPRIGFGIGAGRHFPRSPARRSRFSGNGGGRACRRDPRRLPAGDRTGL